MHLGNSIICPVTGIPMIVAMTAASFYAFKKAKKDFSKDKILLTVAMTSFVFALQMVNFSIPTTSSSGHIIGAILLAAVLGPYAAFLSMSLILLVQALFFADGGLLALGCNIFNMGFLSCFVVYPLVCKFFENKNKPYLGAFLGSIAALELGSLAVVSEGLISGSIGNLALFTSLMTGIHFAIGIVEGLFTALVYAVAKKAGKSSAFSLSIGVLAIITAGAIANYASAKPDGLEWSLLNLNEGIIANAGGQIYSFFELVQAKTAFLCGMSTTCANLTGLVVLSAVTFCVFFLFRGGALLETSEK